MLSLKVPSPFNHLKGCTLKGLDYAAWWLNTCQPHTEHQVQPPTVQIKKLKRPTGPLPLPLRRPSARRNGRQVSRAVPSFSLPTPRVPKPKNQHFVEQVKCQHMRFEGPQFNLTTTTLTLRNILEVDKTQISVDYT